MESKNAIQSDAGSETPDQSKLKDLRLFLFLSVLVAPILSVVIVGGYGLMIWIYQMIAGPPTY